MLDIKINLLPKRNYHGLILVMVTVCFTVSFSILSYWLVTDYMQTRSELTAVEELVLTELQIEQGLMETLGVKEGTVHQENYGYYYEQLYHFLTAVYQDKAQMIQELRIALPEQARILSFQVENEEQAYVELQTLTISEMTQYINRLNESTFFDHVNVVSIMREQQDEQSTAYVTIIELNKDDENGELNE